MNSVNTPRVAVSINKDLLAQVDEFASSLHINRSSAISVLISEALEYKKALGSVEKFLSLMKENKTQE